MSIWSSSPLSAPPQTEDIAELIRYLKKTINQQAIMLKELDHVLNGNIDLKNVRVKSLDADRLNVDELSAITANMGKLTSGEIYGALISTSETVYPRVTMDPSSIAFSVQADANNGIQIPAFDGGVSKIIFIENGNQSTIYNDGVIGTSISGFLKVSISGAQGITLSPGSGYIRVPSFDDVYDQDTNTTLREELNAIYNLIATKSNVGHTHSVTTTAGGGTFTTST